MVSTGKTIRSTARRLADYIIDETKQEPLWFPETQWLVSYRHGDVDDHTDRGERGPNV